MKNKFIGLITLSIISFKAISQELPKPILEAMTNKNSLRL